MKAWKVSWNTVQLRFEVHLYYASLPFLRKDAYVNNNRISFDIMAETEDEARRKGAEAIIEWLDRMKEEVLVEVGDEVEDGRWKRR